MKRLLTITILFITLIALCPASGFAKVFKSVYKGKIAGKNVRVELYLDDADYTVRGSYYYYNAKGKKLSASLNLQGQCNPISPRRNYYTLTESFNGKYSGSWDANYNAENGLMTGTFTNPKGKTYNINLREVE